MHFDERSYFRVYRDVEDAIREGTLPSAEHHWWYYGRKEGRQAYYLTRSQATFEGRSPKITVVMPIFNSEKFLRKALESVFKQTEKDWELLLVDDGSTDKTPGILLEYKDKDPRVLIFGKQNGGTGSALNLGFRFARGKYQTWLSSDSWWEPRCLEKLAAALDKNPSVVMAYADFQIYHQSTGKTDDYRTPEFDKDLLQRECFVGHNWLFRKEAKEAAGEYDLGLCEDYDMVLKMAELGPMKRVPLFLGVWRNHDDNLTNQISIPDGWRQASRVKAKHCWKNRKYKVALVCPYWDAAGVGWLLSRGMNDLSEDFALRHILRRHSGMEVGSDLLIGTDDYEIKRILEEADIIHCNQVYPGTRDCKIDLLPYLRKKKPFILHLHWGVYEWNSSAVEKLRAKYPHIKLLSCSPVAENVFEGARWVPNYIPLTKDGKLWDGNFYTPAEDWEKREGPVRFICHHNYLPGKGVLQLKEMFELLEDDPKFWGFKGQHSVEGRKLMPLREYLGYKKGFDVCIDQITQGFIGMAGWEAMAQGLVVIARLDAYSLSSYAVLGEGTLPPIVNCDRIDEVARMVTKLSKDRDEVTRLGREGRKWMLKYYNAPKILGVYEKIYKEVLGI